MPGWVNWAETAGCDPRVILRPQSEEEIAGAVKEAQAASEHVRVAGTGHSFTDIVCTDGTLLSLDRYARVLSTDAASGLVTVQAGITLLRLNEELARAGLAMPNLGDIAYQTVAGAISTATHGTGIRLGNLATQVRALTFVTADGSVARCSPAEDPELFRAARVSLGALGVISTVTLQCVPQFTVYAIEEPRRLDEVLGELDALVDGNEHFEFFWFPHTDRVLAKRNNRTDRPARPKSGAKAWFEDILLENHAYGLACRVGRRKPERIPSLARLVARFLSRSELVDRSDRIFASPRLVRFAEMEYAIGREHAATAVRRVRSLIDDAGLRISFPVEVRFIAPDDIPLSPAFGRDTCTIAVHVFIGMEYERYFRGVEAIMESFGGRPHWGKLHFRTAATLRPAYPEWEAFAAVRRRLDPEGRFRNEYLDRVLGPP